MGFLHRLFGGKGGGGPGTGGGIGDGGPVCIMSRKEDSLAAHIARIEASGGVPAERSYQGLSLHAIRVSGTGSFLSWFGTILQEVIRGAAPVDFPGAVLELKDTDGRPIPRGMLLRILGVASFEGRERDGDLVIFPPPPQGPDIILAFLLRGDPGTADGEMKTDTELSDILKQALGRGERLPSEQAHAAISGFCRPDTPLGHLPRLVVMISERLRKEGIPEPNILDFMRAYLSGTCPSCHRPYTGEEIVLLCGLKQSQKVQEIPRNRGSFTRRVPGEEKDLYWLLDRLNRGICLNPLCKSGSVSLSWIRRSPP